MSNGANNTLHTVGYDILQQTVWYNTGTILYISMVFSHIIEFLYAFYYWIKLTDDNKH
jgi:quinol-cytochrome oxidoreductase complex cytochrome b subunit